MSEEVTNKKVGKDTLDLPIFIVFSMLIAIITSTTLILLLTTQHMTHRYIFNKHFDIGFQSALVCRGLSPTNILAYETIRDTVSEYRDNKKECFEKTVSTWNALIRPLPQETPDTGKEE